MINYDLAKEISDAIQEIMVRRGIPGQLEARWDGNSITQWIGKLTPDEATITVIIERSPKTKKTEEKSSLKLSDNPGRSFLVAEYYRKCAAWGVPREVAIEILEDVEKTSSESGNTIDVAGEAANQVYAWAVINPTRRINLI